MSTELQLGLRMYEFEAQQVVKGLRGPLPKTPVISNCGNQRELRATLRELYWMYGDITRELFMACTEFQTERPVNRYMKLWEEMKDEGISRL
tara:strand:- start:195 stop:470 length:276 start_codon:yes stop_codon:yes gene_type:complete